MNIDSIIAKVEKRIAKDTVLRQKLLGAKKLIGQVLEPEVLKVKKGQITPAGRKRIAAAQRKRWAAAKKVLPAE